MVPAIIARVNRRFHVRELSAGLLNLDEQASRHLRDVLRIGVGEAVELFDDRGQRAAAVVHALGELVTLEVSAVQPPAAKAGRLMVAAAVPKGPRADWMVEKLSELGTSVYLPLQTQRSVVRPEAGKLQRWSRLAAESARQCRREDVMQVREPIALKKLAESAEWAAAGRWYLSTREPCRPAAQAIGDVMGAGVGAGASAGDLLALVGPEGGFTDAEELLLRERGFAAVGLTSTILRIETAALAVASLAMIWMAMKHKERLQA